MMLYQGITTQSAKLSLEAYFNNTNKVSRCKNDGLSLSLKIWVLEN